LIATIPQQRGITSHRYSNDLRPHSATLIPDFRSMHFQRKAMVSLISFKLIFSGNHD